MVWQATATTAIEFRRAWRFRVNTVRIGMFEMLVLLVVWFYLPFGIKWALAPNATPLSPETHPLAHIPLWLEGIWALGTVGLLLYVRFGRKLRLGYLGFEQPHWKTDSAFFLILVCLAGGIYVLVLTALAGAIWLWPDFFNARSVDPIPGVLHRLFGVSDIDAVKVLSFVVFAPIMEEIWFRGWMYPVVRKHFGPVFSVIAVALIFAFAHGQQLPISQLIGGLVFTYAYEKRPTLYIPIALHMLGNGSLLILSALLAP